MNVDVETIERAAFDAWPAAEVLELGGWRLRFNHGVTNRGNSVWPGPGQADERGLDHAVGAVEAFYRERGCPALFQLTPIAQPGNLDAVLETRGFLRASPVRVQAGDARSIAGLSVDSGLTAGCEDSPSPAWIDLATVRGRYSGVRAGVFMAMLDRLKGRAGFAWAGEGNEPAATGMVVVAPPWAGIFATRTEEAARGRGLGRAVLVAAARWAAARGACNLYLQVEEGNAAALSLFGRAGFETRYGYHYRKLS